MIEEHDAWEGWRAQWGSSMDSGRYDGMYLTEIARGVFAAYVCMGPRRRTFLGLFCANGDDREPAVGLDRG